MTFHGFLLGAGMLTALLPLGAVFLRGRSRLLQASVAACAVCSATFLFTILRWIQSGPLATSSPWAYGMIAASVPLLLAGYLLSSTLGRENPRESFRILRRTFALLGFVGLFFLATHRTAPFVTEVTWVEATGYVGLGALGKAYLSFLLIGIVFIGYNLECTYRVAPPSVRQRLRAPFLGIFAVLGYLTYILTTGILYSTLDTHKLVACGGPFALANVLVAYGILRGALSDHGAPVSRSIVYSSFTALLAGFYVLAIGGMAQLSALTKWSPDQVVTLTFVFLAALLALLLLISNRFQRRARRFIDRNFYVHRYDYRAQWSLVTESLDRARGREAVLAATSSLLADVFQADQVTIAMRDEVDHGIRPHLGKGHGDPQAVLQEAAPLLRILAQERRSILLEKRSDDFEYIPIYAENGDWLEATASQIVAPLFFDDDLVGLLGLERSHGDDPLGYEEVALLDSIAGHVAAALRAAQLSEELAEAREMELMSQWSNMILHDLKNYLTPLRMIAQNLETHREKPNVAEIAAVDLHRVADRMDSLVRTLSELRESPELSRGYVDVNALVRETVDGLQLSRRDGLQIELKLEAERGVLGDPGLLQRVLENLVTNAVEAMEGRGTLTLATDLQKGSAGTSLVLSVGDTGPGMSETFLRERLFRPFATTKRRGLGLGLYQCRAILKAHDGHLRVEGRPGEGSVFRVFLRAARPVPAAETMVPVAAATEGAF